MEQERIATIEQQCLSFILKNNHLILSTDNIFISNTAKNIFKAIRTLHDTGKEITPHSIHSETVATESSLTPRDIKSLYDIPTSEGEFPLYYKDLKEYYTQEYIKLNHMQDLVSAITTTGKPDFDKIKELIGGISGKITELITDETYSFTPEQGADHYQKELNGRYESSNVHTSGDAMLDDALELPFQPGEIGIIQGRTSMGKSLFATYLHNCMINLKVPNMYFNYEMSLDAHMHRLISMRTGVEGSFFKNSERDSDKQDAINRLIEQAKNDVKGCRTTRIIDKPSLDLDGIEAEIHRFKAETGAKWVNVFIDLLTMVPDFKENKVQHTSIEYAMDKVSEIAKNTNSYIMGLAQTNRASETDKKLTKVDQINSLKPELKNIKSSSSLEERPRQVLSVFRRHYYLKRYFPEQAKIEDDVMEIQILKNSNGDTGKVLRYLLNLTNFQIFPFVDTDTEEEVTTYEGN